MISLVLPYWDRRAAASHALDQLERTYRGVDLEVVVVDDGNPTPFVAPKGALDFTVVRLPAKAGPMCPCTAWNAGARAARGDILVLSCIEILHTYPVLEQLAAEVKRLGPKGYALAAAWCPEHRAWHCHSTVRVPDCPVGTGIAFCGALHKAFFLEVGFDEAYRDGAGYEDRDFIRRMVKAGARWSMRDDLVVVHPKTGASIKWSENAFQRNEALYRSRWQC